MKKNFLVLFSFFAFIFSGCKYGLNEAFGRANEVNERSPVVVNLDNSEYKPNDNDDKFSVLIVNDLHFGRIRRDAGKREEDAFYAKFEAVASDLKAAGCELKFAVANGDVVEVGNADLYAQFSEFCKKVQEIVSPEKPEDFKIYMNIGNHDLYNGGYSNWKNTAYQKVSSFEFTTGTTDHKISWYFLDSGNGTLGPKQFESFKNTAMADPNPKIVFAHYPLYADGLIYFTYQNRNERDKIISLLAKTNTMEYIAAHSHESCVDYSYGGRFTEHITQSYLDQRQFAILKIENGDCTYERYTY